MLVVSACPLRMQLELVEHDPMVPMFSSAHCTDVFIFPSPTNIEQQCIYSNIPSSIVTFTGASTTICVCVCVCVCGGGGGGGGGELKLPPILMNDALLPSYRVHGMCCYFRV